MKSRTNTAFELECVVMAKQVKSKISVSPELFCSVAERAAPASGHSNLSLPHIKGTNIKSKKTLLDIAVNNYITSMLL